MTETPDRTEKAVQPPAEKRPKPPTDKATKPNGETR